MRAHIVKEHGKDVAETEQLIEHVWNKSRYSAVKKVDQLSRTEALVDDEVRKDVNDQVSNDQLAEDSTDLSTKTLTDCKDDQKKTTKAGLNRSRDVWKTSSPSPHMFQCGQPGCSFTVGDMKGICGHWNKFHADHDIRLDGGPRFQEVWSGKQRRLFDVFSFVVMCQICKTIRQVYGQEYLTFGVSVLSIGKPQLLSICKFLLKRWVSIGKPKIMVLQSRNVNNLC
jgi:hypothetical protein